MKEKYLPIGSVVDVKGYSNKLMINGYFGLNYTGSVNVFDYEGITYPAGKLKDNQIFAFNHADIIAVNFIGFVNEEFKVLNDNLNNKQSIEETKFKFDENGVVVVDLDVADDIFHDSVVSENINPFSKKIELPVNNVNDNQLKDYTFDENGVIVSDNTSQIKPEEVNTYQTVPTPGTSINGYQFDENGVIVSDNTSQIKPEEVNAYQTVPTPGTSINGYQFDENGVIVSDNTSQIKPEEVNVYQTVPTL
ncbi:MAG: DUF4176 domain-containing protein, partial [bacterium]